MKRLFSSFGKVLLLGALILGGCASVPPGSAILQQQAKRMMPPDGWGAIYVFRPSMPPGDTLWGVNLDSKHFGYLAPSSYLYGIAQPGPHTLDLAYPGSITRFEVTRGSNNYFKISSGFPGMILRQIGADEAKALLGEYTPSALNIFENDKFRRLFGESEVPK